jgi:cellulose synthase/poly-beta-1,6-N-acetylglucosamine synthase-like glycosyltransferase
VNLFSLLENGNIALYSFFMSGIIVIGLWIATCFGIIYHKIIYPKIYKHSYLDSYQPKCSVIIPCKGIPQDFEKNITSFTELEYPHYEIIYTVESNIDPAVPIINKIVKKNPRASLVIAGITHSCSQKNFNMIAALDKTNNPDVYVFADSDIKPNRNWLTELIKPLSKNDISVTTGFRWLYSSTGKIGELTNSYHNSLLFILFSTASFIQNIGLWGGSMAIKKREFEEMAVKDYWAKTVVDDISLSKLITKHSKKSVMVSTCVTPTNDALQSIGQSITWFERQVMFLKAYHKSLWVFAILLVSSCFYLQFLLPFSLLLSYYTNKTFLSTGGASSLLFILGTMSTALVYPLLGKQPTLVRFLMLQPISLFTLLFGVFKTLFTNTVTWSGFVYKLNFRGMVTSVKQK